MQIQKTDIRQRLLEVAKEEFLANGFKNASMRKIAQKSEVGLSNIYNYFKNKDELYRAVLKPLLLRVQELADEHNEERNLSIEVFTSKAFFDENLQVMVNLIENFKAELRLLLFHSYGSSLENFREDYINMNAQIGLEYLEKMKAKYPELNTKVSKVFIRILVGWMLTIIGELVQNEQLSHQEIEQFMTEYITYSTGGWQRLMQGS